MMKPSLSTHTDFRLVEVPPLNPEKRWVLVAPENEAAGAWLRLAKASTRAQRRCIDNPKPV